MRSIIIKDKAFCIYEFPFAFGFGNQLDDGIDTLMSTETLFFFKEHKHLLKAFNGITAHIYCPSYQIFTVNVEETMSRLKMLPNPKTKKLAELLY